jgi:hypothetical protein
MTKSSPDPRAALSPEAQAHNDELAKHPFLGRSHRVRQPEPGDVPEPELIPLRAAWNFATAFDARMRKEIEEEARSAAEKALYRARRQENDQWTHNHDIALHSGDDTARNAEYDRRAREAGAAARRYVEERQAGEARRAQAEQERAQERLESAARSAYLGAGGTVAGWEADKARIVAEARRQVAIAAAVDAEDTDAAATRAAYHRGFSGTH